MRDRYIANRIKVIFFLYNINPVEVEICSDVIDDTMDIYMTNQGDGLLFDPEHRGIFEFNGTSNSTRYFLIYNQYEGRG